MQDFTLKRIQINEYGALNFFAPIKHPKLKTALELKAREVRILIRLKEDRQAFGLLVERKCNSYPPTSFYLNLSDSSGKFQQIQIT